MSVFRISPGTLSDVAAQLPGWPGVPFPRWPLALPALIVTPCASREVQRKGKTQIFLLKNT